MVGPDSAGGERGRRETATVTRPLGVPDDERTAAVTGLLRARASLVTIHQTCDQLEDRLGLVAEVAERRGTIDGPSVGPAPEPKPEPDLGTETEGPSPARPVVDLPPAAPYFEHPPEPELEDGAVGPRRSRRGAVAVAVLAGAGSLLVADAVATVTWQEPVTALLAQRQQNRLEDELATIRATLPRPAAARGKRESSAQRVRRLAGAERSELRRGKAVGKLRIPRLGGSWVIVQGTGESELKTGPGHYGTSSLPGLPGTTAVAGHRTTYGAPFRHIDRLRAGDRITAEMPYGTITYRVEGHRVVDPSDTKVLRDIGRPRLVLTACTPLYSAAQRWVVFARQVRARPAPAPAPAPASERPT